MNRREFLKNGLIRTMGAALGCGWVSRAIAFEDLPAFKPVVSIIIDDIGYSVRRAERFLDINIPITYAILPRLPRSVELAGEIHRLGREIMLHQPMEPLGDYNPGPGALFKGDDKERILNTIRENIMSVPFAAGVNNHMGSRFTSCRREMEATLAAIKGCDLFFIDSLTSPRSVGYRTAREIHLPAASRNVFLDTVIDEQAILRQLHRLAAHARQYGAAIGIGHPHPQTASAIRRFASGGVADFAYASAFLK